MNDHTHYQLVHAFEGEFVLSRLLWDAAVRIRLDFHTSPVLNFIFFNFLLSRHAAAERRGRACQPAVLPAAEPVLRGGRTAGGAGCRRWGGPGGGAGVAHAAAARALHPQVRCGEACSLCSLCVYACTGAAPIHELVYSCTGARYQYTSFVNCIPGLCEARLLVARGHAAQLTLSGAKSSEQHWSERADVRLAHKVSAHRQICCSCMSPVGISYR